MYFTLCVLKLIDRYVPQNSETLMYLSITKKNTKKTPTLMSSYFSFLGVQRMCALREREGKKNIVVLLFEDVNAYCMRLFLM